MEFNILRKLKRALSNQSHFLLKGPGRELVYWATETIKLSIAIAFKTSNLIDNIFDSQAKSTCATIT